MKKIINPLLFLSLIVFAVSCDDSFLDENKKTIDGYTLDVPLNVYPVNEYTDVSALLPELKNKDFKVIQFPILLHFESLKGKIDAMGNLTFKIKVDPFDYPPSVEPYELGNIILDISDFGMLSIPVVHLNYGVPKANIEGNSFDFGTHLTEGSFTVTNDENGVLLFRLTEKPSWVTIQQSGLIGEYMEIGEEMLLSPYGWNYFSIIPDRNKLAPGEYEGRIVIETNDPSNPEFTIKLRITILSYENPESMKAIEGTVIDAKFDKSTNTLFYITHNPVKLVSYNMDTDTKIEKKPERSPASIRLSADNKTILLAESGMVEFIEPSTLKTKEKIELNFSVLDIEDGENGYYYLTNSGNEIFSYNTLTKEIKKLSIFESGLSLVEANMLMKVNGKSQLLMSRKGYSPNGIYLIDFSDPENLSFVNYWHLSFGEKFFTSSNKKYVYSKSNGHIYSIPDATNSSINDLGKFVPDGTGYDDYYHYKWFDHTSGTSSVWASYNYYSNFENIVIEFDDKTFERRRIIKLNDYVTTIHGKKDYYKTLAPFLFSNNEGDRLILIKNVDDYNANFWHLEIVDCSN